MRAAASRCHARALAGIGLGVWLLACGGRSELVRWDQAAAVEPSAGGNTSDEPAAVAVEFPSIADTIAVPEPTRAPDPLFRDDGLDQRIANGECPLSSPALDTLLARMQADVLAQPAADRPFLRYVSTGALLSSRCSVGAALALALDALPLVLNSISLSESPAQVRVVAEELGLARIDLREPLWNKALRIGTRDFADGWELLAAYAPQSVPWRGPEADALLEQLGTRVAFLPVNDLLHAALSADVYYGLLEAPATLDELRAGLGIPAELDREPNAYWRALTTQSRISRQDRLVLRYRGPVAARLFWRTVDLRPETSYGGAFDDPLTREGDESSVVYTLPNGFPAYFLADSNGRRRNESSVLVDSLENDFVPRTAPSCVRCHSGGGVLKVVDELRPYAATDPNGRFDATQRALIAEVYPEQSDLDALIEADGRRIEDAWARAGVSHSRSPTVTLLSAYEGDLLPEYAAAELFVSPTELRDRRPELPAPVRVLASIGSLDRASFNSIYREALCALSAGWRNRPLDCP